MHVGRKFTLFQTVRWTFTNILVFILISAVVVVPYQIFDWKWLGIPWQPISLIGIAVAFTIAFKNNSAYDRLWEARKIWGKIVNDSRTWGTMAIDYPDCDRAESKMLISRHIAWMTALRFQLRQIKPWEHVDRESRKKRKYFHIDEYRSNIDDKMKVLLSDEEWNEIKNTSNPAAQLLKNQSSHLSRLENDGKLEHFFRIEMERQIQGLLTAQGMSERIKNFPFPRQYASLSTVFIWLFILLLPFGMMPQFESLGFEMVWMTIPFCVIISWVFHTMELIGDYSENPFEGFVNDVPITTISQGIENDLLQMLDRSHVGKTMEIKKHIEF